MTNPPPSPEALNGATIAGQRIPSEVVASLREAAQRTGVDFDFLVAQASLESGFQAAIRSQRSSASGLFQFTGNTWLAMVREHGAKYGLGALATEIKLQPNGRFAVADRAVEKQILDLRKDVQLSAFFAGELAKSNRERIETALGRKANAADLHLAHLLGANGAVHFLKAREHDARQNAAAVAPAAAKHNPSLFYARGTRAPQTVAAVYRTIQERIGVPLRQVAALEREQLRPALGLMDGAPRVVAANARTDRRA